MKILSQIRVLDVDQLYPFEWTTDDKTSEVNLDDIKLIRHPFLATSLDDDNFLLLEGTDYFRALADSGLTHFPVQVCPSESIGMITTRLAFADFSNDDLVRLSSRHTEQIQLEEPTGVSAGSSFIKINFRFMSGQSRDVYLRNSSRSGCPLSLETLFRAAGFHGRYFPITGPSSGSGSVTTTIPVTAILSLPSFRIEDMKTAATAERLFPPGVLRVESDCRILDIDFPMTVLASYIPASEKEAFFRDLILIRQQRRKTTSYRGHVYLLNR